MEVMTLRATRRGAAIVGLWSLAVSLAAAYLPVSYTHLDVYKRQALSEASYSM